MEGYSSFQTIFLSKDYKTDFDHRNETNIFLKDNEGNEQGGNGQGATLLLAMPVLSYLF